MATLQPYTDPETERNLAIHRLNLIKVQSQKNYNAGNLRKAVGHRLIHEFFSPLVYLYEDGATTDAPVAENTGVVESVSVVESGVATEDTTMAKGAAIAGDITMVEKPATSVVVVKDTVESVSVAKDAEAEPRKNYYRVVVGLGVLGAMSISLSGSR